MPGSKTQSATRDDHIAATTAEENNLGCVYKRSAAAQTRRLLSWYWLRISQIESRMVEQANRIDEQFKNGKIKCKETNAFQPG